MTSSLNPALLLHRRPWRDTSLLLEAFSAEHGRLGLVARGARTKRGGMVAILQPFQPLLLSWGGRGELLTLHGAEASAVPLGLQGNALIGGFYINELLMRLLPRHDPHEVLFDAYLEALQRLGQGELEWTLRLFECALLEQLGYGLLLGQRGDTGDAIEADRAYCYVAQHGPLPAGQGEGPLIHGSTLLALQQAQWPLADGDPHRLREAKHLLRHILADYLGPRPLASRALWRKAEET